MEGNDFVFKVELTLNPRLSSKLVTTVLAVLM